MLAKRRARGCILVLIILLAACAAPAPAPAPTATPTLEAPNLDQETLDRMAQAERVVFVIAFSHWDTDWHEAFPAYVKRSDGNILAAIQMAKRSPRFRYTLEQVLFVRHFWDTYPEYRADLKTLVQNRQLTFAWAGLVQPETSLAAPAVQMRNLQMGQDWIAATFGAAFVPRTAWQSDAFGNSAALPQFLAQAGIPYLYIGRSQFRCDPAATGCEPLPHAFYWRSPAAPTATPVLVSYLSYPNAWDATHRLPDGDQQVTALQAVVETELARTQSKYIFLPMGSDFIDPLPNLPELVDQWNAANPRTVLVMADPDTAFQYLATQRLPERTVDLNPLWQGFYASRPFAKIADKESEYFLTAADKFGLLVGAPQSSAWYTAAMSAHYDNIGAVSFDSVWEGTQRPRFEQTLATAAGDLARTLAQIASGVPAPVVVFNPSSWPRSGIVELSAPGGLPGPSDLPAGVQVLGPDHLAFQVEGVPPIGFAAPATVAGADAHPAAAVVSGGLVTLSNGLVTLSLDPQRGGTLANLSLAGGPSLVAAGGDDVIFYEDGGDIYGARFGEVRARESQVPAQVTVLANGPLIARAQVAFTLAGQPITKTVTVRADDALVEVSLEIKALPETTALVQTPTTLHAETRTDDLGFMAFSHAVDNLPIAVGDITYRRKLFYPIMAWSDVSEGGNGLTLITHGLQGLGGMDTLNLLLVRQVSDENREGVTDQAEHRLGYAYLPHTGPAADAQPWLAAYAFNQPLIPVWGTNQAESVQVPFTGRIQSFPIGEAATTFPTAYSLLAAQDGLVADLYRRNEKIEALVIGYDPARPVTVRAGDEVIQVEGPFPALTSVEINPK